MMSFVFFGGFLMQDEDQAEAGLLRKTPGDHQRHAGHPGGLAGGGRPGVQASF